MSSGSASVVSAITGRWKVVRVGPDVLCETEAVQVRHFDVGYHELNRVRVLPQVIPCLLAVFGGDNLIIGIFRNFLT